MTNLHSSIVNDHVIKFDVWVKLGNFLTRTQEESVAQFHDICFVHSCNLELGIVITCLTNEKVKMLAFFKSLVNCLSHKTYKVPKTVFCVIKHKYKLFNSLNNRKFFLLLPPIEGCHYFFPAVPRCVIEGKLSNSLGLGGRHNFQAFHDTLHRLVLESRIFSL